MKYCPYCGNPMEDDMVFCSKCGKQQTDPTSVITDEPQKEETVSEEGTATVETAKKESPQTVESSVLSTVPPKNKHTFRNILIVVLVLSVLGAGWMAYKTYKEENGYYSGVSYYEQGDYLKAYHSFQNAGKAYPNVIFYRLLCEGHLYGYLTEAQVDVLRMELNFKDTKDVLVSTVDIAAYFMNGRWETKGGSITYYYETTVDDTNGMYYIGYNLPHNGHPSAKSYDIVNGVYYQVSEDGTQRYETFIFSIISDNQISVYCYSTKETFDLYRK